MPPRIKICGLRTVANALECTEAGADWIGLNFHPASARCVTPAVAAEIVAQLPDHVEAVGLFVDRKPDEIRLIAQATGLNLIQLHGQEPVEDLQALSEFRVIRAFRLGDLAAVDQMRRYLDQASSVGVAPYAVLVDAYVPGREGGTGHRIPSPVLDALGSIERLILAGGLKPDNVAEAVDRVRPWMVDVASGVESSPGYKDPEIVRQFVKNARSCAEPTQNP